MLYRAMGNFESAKDHFSKAYEGFKKLLEPQHTYTIDALEQLNLEIERNVERAENSDEEEETRETNWD